MPTEPFTDPSIGTRSTAVATRYPSPFFDLAGTYLPETPKGLFRYCRYYYYTIAIIGAAVDVHAAYPITDLELDVDDESLKKRWQKILNTQLHIRSFLVECGKDYVTYGNCFVSIYIPFIRLLICPKCRYVHSVNTVAYEWKRFQFEGVCKKCESRVAFEVQDKTIRNIKRVNLVRWSPENIDIEYNPITGESLYKYSLPNQIKQMIAMGRRHIIEKVPMAFIDAAKTSSPIVFNSENIFHLKRPSLAERNMGWGEPALTRTLKDVYYLQVLKKAREQIAHQHIVPLWILFPQPHGELNPYEHLNLAEWRGQIEQEIRKWKLDSNYVPIMPMPLGFQFIGGNFKQLDTTPEVQNLLLNILAGMNMPQEFVYGGLQWSGTSFSIRMLANLFTSYRGQLTELLNGFIIPHISEIFSIKPVESHFTDLKLADDVQHKTLMMSLNQQNKLSTATLLSEMGLDADLEMKKIKQELADQGEVMAKQMVEQEKAKAAALIENIRGQIRSSLMQNQIALDVQQELAEQHIEINPEMDVKLNPNLFKSIFESASVRGAAPYQEETGQPFFVMNPVSVPETVKALAQSLQKNNEKTRKEVMTELQTSMPHFHDLVAQEIAALGGGQVQPSNGPGNRPLGPGLPLLPRPKMDLRPLPEQKPPRRK